MKRTRVASALRAENWRHAIHRILPPWAECIEGETMVKEAWSEVRNLIRQKNELTQLFPNKAKELQKQCDEQIMTVASKLHEKLYEVTA